MNHSLRIIVPESLREYEDVQKLHKTVWGLDDLQVTPLHILMASQKIGGLVLCGYIDDQPVGFIHALCGVDPDSRQIYMYSHNLGVIPYLQGKGIGFQLKLRQKELALDRGINLIRWTFDPLETRNAHLNLNKLGCIVKEYVVDYWGEMDDKLNRGLPSDRLIIEWHLQSTPNAQTMTIDTNEGTEINPDYNLNQVTFDRSGFLAPKHSAKPVSYQTDVSYFVSVPTNFQEIRLQNAGLALEWRMHVRDILRDALSHNVTILRFIRKEHEHGLYELRYRNASAYLLEQ
ncbi:MAG: GNAT family N-acetyltransferase [Chloroflexi bacterium]|nr:GNAT family N-acetyltransferase [Chloroflexota bacterium]